MPLPHWTLAIFAVLTPLFFWLVFRVSMKPGTYEMDSGPSIVQGGFFNLLHMYSRFFYVIAAASAAGGLFAHDANDWPLLFAFTMAGLEALLFVIVLLYFYEGYLASRYPRVGMIGSGSSNYTVGRYSIVMALAVSAVATFVLATLVLIVTVG